MASLGDITLRTDALCKKYEKYTVADNKPKDGNTAKKSSTDAFSDLYEEIFTDVQALNQKAEEISGEKNRASVAEKNAHLRRAKAAIIQTDIPKLQRLVKKGKKVSKEMIAEREDLLEKLVAATNEIPDGVHGVRKPMRAAAASSSRSGGKGSKEIVISGFDESKAYGNSSYYETTEESEGFRSEWQQSKAAQDSVLDEIANGLTQLKSMGQAMAEELEKQDPLVHGIEEKVDSINNKMASNNTKLTNTVYKIRSSRRVCIDIILILVLLGVGWWIYSALASSGIL